jgi:CDP-glucose 4,6-dehydratase
MNKKFWINKHVLITGYEGFLGSNLTRKLIASGAKVVGLDIKINRKDTILAACDYKRFTHIKGSVADYPLLKKILDQYKIDTVFHLAAEALVGKSHDNPLETFSTNTEGTWKLLEACRSFKRIETIVAASTDKAYGSHKKLPYKEDAPLLGSHPYDVSKSCADLIAHAYFHTYGLPVAITRCGNIYGPGDFNFSRIVPDGIRCAASGETLLIRSDGKFTRDYVYVDDIVDGYIILAEKLKKLKLGGEAFNFSDENPLAVKALVEAIFKVFGKKPKYKILNTAKYEIKHQYLYSAKARKILGWKPRITLDEGLRRSAAWYKKIMQ